MEDKFDGIFMSIVNDSQTFNQFFTNLFSFMRRKTDFFSSPDTAREYVLTGFEEQSRMSHYNRCKELWQEQEEDQKFKEKTNEGLKQKNTKVIKTTDAEAETELIQKSQSKEPLKAKEEPFPSPEKLKEIKSDFSELKDGDKGLIPVNNGSETDQYIWTQTLKEITVNIFIPEVRAKDIKLSLTATQLKILINGKVHLEGELHDKCKLDEYFWTIETLEKRRWIALIFEKFEGQTWWKCLLKGETEINTRKIKPENSQLSDLENTRSTVDKNIDIRRKTGGLSSLEEENKREILRRFMEKHPEMDFSNTR